MMKTVRRICGDVDIGSLGYDAVEGLFRILRKRPIAKRSGEKMKPKTAKNIVGELGRFFAGFIVQKNSIGRSLMTLPRSTRRSRLLLMKSKYVRSKLIRLTSLGCSMNTPHRWTESFCSWPLIAGLALPRWQGSELKK